MPDCHSDSKTVEQCVKTRDDGYAKCTKTRDDGYNKCAQSQTGIAATCAQWQTTGYSACNNWGTTCSSWGAFSWLCKAFVSICLGWVWITSTICLVLSYVIFTICVLWTWIPYIVCVAWVWIKNVVCVAWATIVFVFINICCASPVWKALLKCWLPTKDTPRNPIEKKGWILTFEDDFDSGAIDFTKWIDHLSFLDSVNRYSYDLKTLTGADFANGKFPNRYWSPNFTFGPSTVKLVADNTPVKITVNTPEWSGEFSVLYTMQALQWKDKDPLIEQRHGYFEIRCKTPNTRDMWPAFWLFPVTPEGGPKKTWPPELDIFEFMSRKPNIFTTTHHWLTGSKGTRHKACRASKRFHIYACRWDEKTIRWYLDNKLIRIAFKKNQGIGDFIYPMSVIVNSAVDDRRCREPQRSRYPNYFEIDYVRAYKKV